jgi:hypothetical protein
MLSRSTVVVLSLALSLVGVAGCDSSKPSPGKPADAKAEPAPKVESKLAEPEHGALAPAPEGAVAIGRVYVQTCADPKAFGAAGDEPQGPPKTACPALLQDAGVAHCKSLQLGGLLWRLPTLQELESWRGNAALVGYDVFHWSGTAWSDDPGQFWIYDPGSGAKTTAKPDRKPFTIRCVA